MAFVPVYESHFNGPPFMPIQNLFRTLIFFITLAITTTSHADNYLPSKTMSAMQAAPHVNIYSVKHPFPGVLSGGQPSQEELETAKAEGFKTIINLRMPNEMKEWDEPSKVKALGMKYIAIPVGNANDINVKNSSILIAALEDQNNYPVLIHCASGNRVGALFALDAYNSAKMNKATALQIGRDSGLTSLEPAVAGKLK